VKNCLLRAALLASALAGAGPSLAQEIVDSIDVAATAIYSLAYNRPANVLYAVSNQSYDFIVVSCDSHKVIARLNRRQPGSVVYDALDEKAYFSQATDWDSVIVIDGRSHSRLRAVQLNWATQLLWDPVADRLFVNCDEDGVAVIDCRTDSILCRIGVGGDPDEMHINQRHRKLYVNNWGGESVSIVDLNTNQVIRTIPIGSYAESGWFSEAYDKYYCGRSGHILVIDGAGDTIIGQIPVPPEGTPTMAGDDSTGVLLAAAYDSIVAIDIVHDSIVARHGVGGDVSTLFRSRVTGLFYSANYRYSVTVLSADGKHVVRELRTAHGPFALASGLGNRLYLTCTGSRFMYIIRDSVSGVAEEPGRTSPVVAPVLRAWPSPFRRTVTIVGSPAESRETKVRVFSLNGELVRTLSACWLSPGLTGYVWDGRDGEGREVSEGVYTLVMGGHDPTRVSVIKLK